MVASRVPSGDRRARSPRGRRRRALRRVHRRRLVGRKGHSRCCSPGRTSHIYRASGRPCQANLRLGGWDHSTFARGAYSFSPLDRTTSAANTNVRSVEMLLGLRTVIYSAPDLAKAKAWYATLLGIPPYFDEAFYVGFNVGGYELGLDPNAKTAPGA